VADGLQGKAALTANTPALLATAPNSGSVFNVLIVNNSGQPTTLTLWVSTATVSTGLTNADLVTAGRILPGYAEYEKNALVLSAGESVWAQDLYGYCVVRVAGFVG
jgi:hypothetical protein